MLFTGLLLKGGMDDVPALTLDSASGFLYSYICPAAAKLPAIFPSKDLQQKSGTVIGWQVDNFRVPAVRSYGMWSHGHNCNKEITTGSGCFSTGMGVQGQLGKLRSWRCSGLARTTPSRFGVSSAVSRSLEQRPAEVPSSRHLPLSLWATSLWCLWGIYFAFLSKGTSMYKKRGVKYYNRPLTPNSSTGKVCSAIANIEDAALKTVYMESVICPSSAWRVRRPPSHSQREEPSVLRFVILHWALPACVSKRSRGPPLGRLNDSSEIFK